MGGYLSLWSLFHLFKLITGKEGMGYGDFKLLAALGAWLGVGTLPVIVFVAALVGLVAALVMRATKRQPIAFGPALAIAGWLVFAGTRGDPALGGAHGRRTGPAARRQPQ